MRVRFRFLALVLCGIVPGVASGQDPRARIRRHVPRPSFLDNGVLKIGVDLNLGGAIVWLSPSKSETNLVNSWDWGRQIQMSHYSGPPRYRVPGKEVAAPWADFPWNPVQAGDHFGNPSRLLEHANDGKTLRIRCRPMQWSLKDAPAECAFETRLRLDGSMVQVRCRLINQRTDRTRYGPFSQELPAIYLNGAHHRLMTYTGDEPFRGGPLERIVKKPGGKKDAFPWARFLATERWAALVNDAAWGVGIFQPACVRFLGGFSGKPGQGGPMDAATGYLAPVRPEVLDHDIVYEYDYVLIVGDLKEIRRHVYDLAQGLRPPDYRFRKDRQGWHAVHAIDPGWLIQEEWKVEATGRDPQLIGPPDFWIADEVPRLTLEAAFRTPDREARIFWQRREDAGFSAVRSLAFPILGDGKTRKIVVDLSAAPTYRGPIVRLRLDPGEQGGAGEWVRLRSIRIQARN